MGLEKRCRITWEAQSRIATVHLDSLALEVGGRPKLSFPLSTVRRAEAREGRLEVETDRGSLRIELGDAAEAWALKIRSPRGRIDKLGVKPGLRVRLIGTFPPSLDEDLSAAGAQLVSRGDELDLIFLGARQSRDLAQLSTLRRRLAPAGGIWVVRTKGKQATIKEAEVRDAARDAGLVDVKVVSFSDAESADKLVIPLGQRGPVKAPARRR